MDGSHATCSQPSHALSYCDERVKYDDNLRHDALLDLCELYFFVRLILRTVPGHPQTYIDTRYQRKALVKSRCSQFTVSNEFIHGHSLGGITRETATMTQYRAVTAGSEDTGGRDDKAWPTSSWFCYFLWYNQFHHTFHRDILINAEQKRIASISSSFTATRTWLRLTPRLSQNFGRCEW